MDERLQALMRLAIKYFASEIFFYTANQEARIQMRIEGEKREVKTKYTDYKLIRYLQYLANLDVGKFTPQTGEFEMIVDNTLLKLRFAVISDHEYSNGVLRVLESKPAH